METITIKNLRLFKHDILIEAKSKNEVNRQQRIQTVEYEEHKEQANWFHVLKVGADIKDVSVGDTILLPYNEHTPPFFVDGSRVAITDLSKVIGVLDE